MDEIRVAPVIKPKITFKYSRLYLSVRYNLAQVFVEPLFIGISNVHHDHWAPWKEPIDEIEGIVEFPVGYYDLPDGQEYRIDIVDFIGNPVTWSPTISIAVPPYSELAYTEAPNDEIKRLENLFEEFNRLVEELKEAHNVLEKLPSVQEAQFWLKIASLSETFAKLPLEVWIAFWKFLRCDDCKGNYTQGHAVRWLGNGRYTFKVYRDHFSSFRYAPNHLPPYRENFRHGTP